MDFKGKTATVCMTGSTSLSRADISKAFKGSNYGVSGFEEKKSFYLVSVSGMT